MRVCCPENTEPVSPQLDFVASSNMKSIEVSQLLYDLKQLPITKSNTWLVILSKQQAYLEDLQRRDPTKRTKMLT